MSETIITSVESPIGPLTLTATEGSLTGLHMADQRHMPAIPAHATRDDDWFADVAAQLDAYFSGDLTSFDVPLSFEGTQFQHSVWTQLRAIPYGETISYAELARRVDNPKACRAVGLANGRNPIAIIIPCHRVVGANGDLTGFGGGLARKEWLLSHESPSSRRGEAWVGPSPHLMNPRRGGVPQSPLAPEARATSAATAQRRNRVHAVADRGHGDNPGGEPRTNLGLAIGEDGRERTIDSSARSNVI